MRHVNPDDLPQELLPADDQAAYEIIFERYAKALWAEAFRLLDENQAAKDLVQELFIEIWEKKSLRNVQTTIRAYLFQSLRYKCYRYNHNKNAEQHRIDNYSVFLESSTHMQLRIEQEELQQTLDAAIQSLPIQSSSIFRQVFLEGKKRKDVAANMGISINTVNVHIHTACKKLQERLKKIL